MTTERALAGLALVGAVAGVAAADITDYKVAGSVQLDYLAVPTEQFPRSSTLDATTVELSFKVSRDFTPHASATVKACFACHGVELAMIYVDLRAADELTVRVGRITPELGSFPLRYDPANHRTSDKPLIYDMGRMLRLRDWNEGILPAPWVDNGVEAFGTHFFSGGRLDYAAYLLAGPKAGPDPVDMDFTLSRSPAQYYVDNNSAPVAGARLGGTIELGGDASLALGLSAMAGHYDPQRALRFVIAGADAVLDLDKAVIRAEYLLRRTEISLGDDPASRFKYGPGPDGQFADYFTKDGFYVEAEVPVPRVDLIARWDGLRRRGNVLATSALSSRSTLYRYTLAAAIRVESEIRIKASAELYDFNDFANEVALHLGVATAF